MRRNESAEAERGHLTHCHLSDSAGPPGNGEAAIIGPLAHSGLGQNDGSSFSELLGDGGLHVAAPEKSERTWEAQSM